MAVSDLSRREMAGIARSFRNGEVSDDQMRTLWESLDEDEIQNAMQAMLDNFLVPKFEQVRERAEQDSQDVRALYASMSDSEQQEVFDQAVDELVAACYELRARPRKGAESLMGLLRDPWTVEALLLIFENEEHIDPAYSAQLKEFAATHLQWIGCALAPEMYRRAVVEETYQQLGLQPREQPRE